MKRKNPIAFIALHLVPLQALGAEPTRGPPICSLDISVQPLDSALQEMARQCEVNLFYFSGIVAGLTGGPLRGRYTPDEALHRLLDEPRLQFSHVDPLTIKIQAGAVPGDQAPTARSNVGQSARSTAVQTDSELQEVAIIATSEGFVATRTDTPLRDIPQTLSIISAEQMRQENELDLNEALSDAVGITPVQGGTRLVAFYSRGFEIANYTIDGGGSINGLNLLGTGYVFAMPNLSEFDHIEVLRGSDALFGADGPPGAEIDLIRKRPLETAQVLSTTSAGSWNNYRQELDATGPIALDGALRARVDVTYGRQDYFYRLSYNETRSAFGVVEWGLSSDTRLTAGGSYSWDHTVPFTVGLPLYSDGTDPHLPLDTAYTFNWSRFDTQVHEAYLEFEHAFGAAWHLKVHATMLDQELEYAAGVFDDFIDVRTDDIVGQPFATYTIGPARQRQYNLETTLTGSAQWLGLNELFALGADFRHSHYSTTEGATGYFGPSSANAYHYNPADYPDPWNDPNAGAGPVAAESRTIPIAGLFGSLRVEIGKRWWVTLGLRLSDERPKVDFTYFDPADQVNLRFRYNNILTPFAAVQFALNEIYSLYASYADIYFSNNGAADDSGRLLSPSHGITIETGLKGAWRDGALNGSIALYSVLEKGIGVFNAPASGTGANVYCCYTSSGKNTSKGLDLELAGKLRPNWSIGAGYTANTVSQGNSAYEINEPLVGLTPHHMLKLWTSVRLPGAWSRWSLGGSLRAQSSIYYSRPVCPGTLDANGNCSSSYVYETEGQKSYAVVSPRIDFQLHPQWRLGFTVNNAFDRRYFQTVAASGNFYGEPRSFLVRLDGRF